MKKICKACEAAIAAGSVQRDAVLAAHLAECPECRAFAAFEEQVLHAAPAIERTPDLKSILLEKERRDAARRRNIRLVVWPLSLAAAALIAVAGLSFTLGTEPVPSVPAKMPSTVALGGNWQSEEMWSDASLDLVWDTVSERESSCRASLAAARQESGIWNIEEFNPIEEEMEI